MLQQEQRTHKKLSPAPHCKLSPRSRTSKIEEKKDKQYRNDEASTRHALSRFCDRLPLFEESGYSLITFWAKGSTAFPPNLRYASTSL